MKTWEMTEGSVCSWPVSAWRWVEHPRRHGSPRLRLPRPCARWRPAAPARATVPAAATAPAAPAAPAAATPQESGAP